MSGHDADTLQFYARTAATYTASGKDGASRPMPAFLASLKPHSKVLELGCGGGRDALAMLEAGHDVDPTDGTPEIAQQARDFLQPKFPQTKVRVMRFEDLCATATYDAIWANAALLHVPRADLPAILRKIHQALKPGGLHHATYKGGGQDGRDAAGRYFNYLSRDQARALYKKAAPWHQLNAQNYTGGGFDNGATGSWVAISARKP